MACVQLLQSCWSQWDGRANNGSENGASRAVARRSPRAQPRTVTLSLRTTSHATLITIRAGMRRPYVPSRLPTKGSGRCARAMALRRPRSTWRMRTRSSSCSTQLYTRLGSHGHACRYFCTSKWYAETVGKQPQAQSVACPPWRVRRRTSPPPQLPE